MAEGGLPVQDALDFLLSEEDPFTGMVFDHLDKILTEEQKVSFASRGLYDFMQVFCLAVREVLDADNLEKLLCPEHNRRLLRFSWDLWCVDKVNAAAAIKLLVKKLIAQDA